MIQGSKVKVKILRNQNCHVWEEALGVVKDVLDDKGIRYQLNEEVVTNEEEAKRKRFSGSPQVIINGQDVDPDAEEITNYNVKGCRLYFYEGEVYEHPPKGMISDFLNNLGEEENEEQ